MELMADWKAYQSLFCSTVSPQAHPGWLILTHQGMIRQILYAKRNMSLWIGKPIEELRRSVGTQPMLVFEEHQIRDSFRSLWNYPNLVTQSSVLIEQLLGPKSDTLLTQIELNDHFQYLKRISWFLPSKFALYICIYEKSARSATEESSDLFVVQHLVMIFQRLRLVQFYCPELSSPILSQLSQRVDLVRSLSSYHFVPVTGIFVKQDDWADWKTRVKPWPAIFSTLWKEPLSIVPAGALKWVSLGLQAIANSK
jgi:hypothetical protein